MGTMDALEYIRQKFALDYNRRSPFILDLSRWHGLPGLFVELGYKVGAEIGVADGKYSAHLCEHMPGLHLYSIDAWQCYSGYRETVTQSRMEEMYTNAKQRLASYDCDIYRAYSVNAAKHFDNGSLDFVFIDGNHDFVYVTNDIATWEPKVKPGGIVAGHDFHRKGGRDYVCHVKDVVQAWTYSHGIKPWFVVGGDRDPSWFWVKG